MKIVSNPPKAGEQFTASWVWSDGLAESHTCVWNYEDEQFQKKDPVLGWISVDESFFKHVTILVSKGE